MAKASQPACGLWQYLNGRVEKLRRTIPRAQQSWNRNAIHRARVTTRRLKAAIDLLKPLLMDKSRRSFAKTLRRLRRGLGPLRDQDIMLKHLRELHRRNTAPAAVEWLLQRVHQERMRLECKCARKTPPEKMLAGLGRWWGLEQEIKEVEPAARSLARTVVPDQVKSFADRANQLVQSRTAERYASPEDVHALRIAGKLLRYTLELAEPMGFEAPKSILKSFKELQDALGLWHDYVLLGQQSLKGALVDQLPLHDPALYAAVLTLARSCWRKSEWHLDCFVQLWSENGESLAHQILDVFGPPPVVTESENVNGSVAPPRIPNVSAA